MELSRITMAPSLILGSGIFNAGGRCHSLAIYTNIQVVKITHYRLRQCRALGYCPSKALVFYTTYLQLHCSLQGQISYSVELVRQRSPDSGDSPFCCV